MFRNRGMFFCWVIVSSCGGIWGGQAMARGSEWRRVMAEGAGGWQGPMRAVILSEEVPEDVRVDVNAAGGRYGQLRFGSAGAARVTVLLVRGDAGAARVYVDRDRNRVIDARDEVEGVQVGREFFVELSARFLEPDRTWDEPRRVRMRLGSTGRTLNMGAGDWLEGEVAVGAVMRKAWRMDADLDGLYASAGDLVGIDRNGDGKLDGVKEVYAVGSVWKEAGERWVIRGDMQGRSLAVDALRGVGGLRLELGTTHLAERLERIQVMVVSQEGSAFTLEGLGKEAVVPPGSYRVQSVSVKLRGDVSGELWSYAYWEPTFGADHAARVWREVRDGEAAAIDPLRNLRFEMKLSEYADAPRSGGEAQLQPQCTTADGLITLSVTRSVGGVERDQGTEVVLRERGGRELGRVRSGFS